MVGSEVADRLESSGKVIITLLQLKQFVRDRWPDDFPHNFREPSPANAKYSRGIVVRWWGSYLEWAEAHTPENVG